MREFSNSFYEATIPMIANPGQDRFRMGNYRQITVKKKKSKNVNIISASQHSHQNYEHGLARMASLLAKIYRKFFISY